MNGDGFVKVSFNIGNVYAEFVRPTVVELEEDIKDVLGEEALKSTKHQLRMALGDGQNHPSQAGVVRMKAELENAFGTVAPAAEEVRAVVEDKDNTTDESPPATAAESPTTPAALSPAPSASRPSKFKR